MIKKKIFFIGSDHNGINLKKKLIKKFSKKINLIDIGPYDEKNKVDYTDVAKQLGNIVRQNEKNYGILICGTGVGMSIAANKIPDCRAALVTDKLGIGAINNSFNLYNNGTTYLNGNTTVDATFTVSNTATTSSVSTVFMYGKRTNSTDGPIGEIIYSNNGDSVATLAGFRDGADDKGSLVFQTQNGSAGFGTRLTIAAPGHATFTNNLTLIFIKRNLKRMIF